ncbi:hypothetical protein PV325_000046 [Microctonus aethiopoides]|uniref:Cytochrome b5 heme-binding domain-containing protein n=1 Tax=Microctonus aethiopoides TaxID=144406 RepID=A0AA39C6J0_9HYME|nr:hypothetical protein PV326_009318 [Microctonus aethiopoides]KAK0090880.1 hypothetical protein PV325_000046 [Microctonus aethiopoides]KAK0158812.1 hypothetical protein PV328_009763 [Microctonus aethiopoides]
METVFTADEVARHNSANDLWMIMHGGVYNLTKFLQEHPGGEEVLLNLAGMDGTTCFEEMGHTSEAVQLRETLKIGIVAPSKEGGISTPIKAPSITSTENVTTPVVDDDDNWEYQETKPEPSSNLPSIFIGGLVVIYAIIFYYWFF